jgi:hypothetical protein
MTAFARDKNRTRQTVLPSCYPLPVGYRQDFPSTGLPTREAINPRTTTTIYDPDSKFLSLQ